MQPLQCTPAAVMISGPPRSSMSTSSSHLRCSVDAVMRSVGSLPEGEDWQCHQARVLHDSRTCRARAPEAQVRLWCGACGAPSICALTGRPLTKLLKAAVWCCGAGRSRCRTGACWYPGALHVDPGNSDAVQSVTVRKLCLAATWGAKKTCYEGDVGQNAQRAGSPQQHACRGDRRVRVSMHAHRRH